VHKRVDIIGAAAFAFLVIPVAVIGAVIVRAASAVADLQERWTR
jgi:hypothetical protein